MSNVVVNVNRFSVAPELIPGSRWQPYDPELDRPNTLTEGAHLAQYYSNAWLAACKAGEQLQQQAEQEMQRLEEQMQRLEEQWNSKVPKLQQQITQLNTERDHFNGQLAVLNKRAEKAEEKLEMKSWKSGIIAVYIGLALGGVSVGPWELACKFC